MRTPLRADAAPTGTAGPQLAAPSRAMRIRVITLCLLFGLVEGYDLQNLALAVPTLAADWMKPVTAFSGALAASIAGILFGTVLVGPFGDKWPRQTIIAWSCAAFALFSFVSAIASDLMTLFLCRFGIGFAAGACTPSAYALIADFAPRTVATRCLTAMTCMISLGALGGGLAAPALLARHSWPGLFVAGGLASGLLAIAVGLAMRDIPVLRIRQESKAYPSGSAAWFRESFVLPVARLWADDLRGATLYLWLLWSFNSFTFYALANWLPSVLARNGFPLDTALRLASLTWAGGIVGGLLLAWLFDRSASKRLLLASTLLAGALVLLLMAVVAPTVAGWGALLTAVGLAIGGIQSMIPALGARVYPSAILATGLSWGGAVGRGGALLAPLLGGAAIGHGLSAGVLLAMLAAPAAITAIVIARLLAHGAPERI